MLNEVVLMGRLTIAPELRTTQAGKSVCSFPIAVDRGDAERKTDFIDIVAFDKTAEFAAKHLAKGRLTAVQGTLRVNEYQDKEGKRRKSYNVVANKFFFADSKPSQEPQNAPPQLEPYNEDDGDLPF